LHRHGAHFYLTDLSSDNGTSIAGKRLAPDVPYLLRSGDELTLGCLSMKVLFPQ
jgi:predicted component of type VI protein secretion system